MWSSKLVSFTCSFWGNLLSLLSTLKTNQHKEFLFYNYLTISFSFKCCDARGPLASAIDQKPKSKLNLFDFTVATYLQQSPNIFWVTRQLDVTIKSSGREPLILCTKMSISGVSAVYIIVHCIFSIWNEGNRACNCMWVKV